MNVIKSGPARVHGGCSLVQHACWDCSSIGLLIYTHKLTQNVSCSAHARAAGELFRNLEPWINLIQAYSNAFKHAFHPYSLSLALYLPRHVPNQQIYISVACICGAELWLHIWRINCKSCEKKWLNSWRKQVISFIDTNVLGLFAGWMSPLSWQCVHLKIHA